MLPSKASWITPDSFGTCWYYRKAIYSANTVRGTLFVCKTYNAKISVYQETCIRYTTTQVYIHCQHRSIRCVTFLWLGYQYCIIRPTFGSIWSFLFLYRLWVGPPQGPCMVTSTMEATTNSSMLCQRWQGFVSLRRDMSVYVRPFHPCTLPAGWLMSHFQRSMNPDTL